MNLNGASNKTPPLIANVFLIFFMWFPPFTFCAFVMLFVVLAAKFLIAKKKPVIVEIFATAADHIISSLEKVKFYCAVSWWFSASAH